jgi:hypothetical protein
MGRVVARLVAPVRALSSTRRPSRTVQRTADARTDWGHFIHTTHALLRSLSSLSLTTSADPVRPPTRETRDVGGTATTPRIGAPAADLNAPRRSRARRRCRPYLGDGRGLAPRVAQEGTKKRAKGARGGEVRHRLAHRPVRAGASRLHGLRWLTLAWDTATRELDSRGVTDPGTTIASCAILTDRAHGAAMAGRRARTCCGSAAIGRRLGSDRREAGRQPRENGAAGVDRTAHPRRGFRSRVRRIGQPFGISSRTRRWAIRRRRSGSCCPRRSRTGPPTWPRCSAVAPIRRSTGASRSAPPRSTPC